MPSMPSGSSGQTVPTILLIAASRGLGLAMAEEFLKKAWKVVGTGELKSGSTSEQGNQRTSRLKVNSNRARAAPNCVSLDL
jgi:NAD(P)-dependent dehydrogenase (short-subunit alcohol dehydrogenase family)